MKFFAVSPGKVCVTNSAAWYWTFKRLACRRDRSPVHFPQIQGQLRRCVSARVADGETGVLAVGRVDHDHQLVGTNGVADSDFREEVAAGIESRELGAAGDRDV